MNLQHYSMLFDNRIKLIKFRIKIRMIKSNQGCSKKMLMKKKKFII